jgi:hypothetical protein
MGSSNILTNLGKLSALEVAEQLAKRGFVEILKNFAELLAVGAMRRKAAVEFPESTKACETCVPRQR